MCDLPSCKMDIRVSDYKRAFPTKSDVQGFESSFDVDLFYNWNKKILVVTGTFKDKVDKAVNAIENMT